MDSKKTELADNIKFQVIDEDTKLYETILETLPEIENNLNPENTLETKIQESVTLEDKIKEFIKRENPKLFILTPCFGGTCYVNYLICLIKTITLFKQLDFPIQVEFCKNDSLVSRARNNLVARAMTDPEMTHIMFIDNDIAWDPIDIIKLIISEKELVGGIYPLKYYDWNKLIKDPQNPYNSNIVQSWLNKRDNSQLRGLIPDYKIIQHNLLKYNVNYLDNMLQIEDNLAKVKHLATGFMMIRRTVIEQLMKAFPSTKYTDDINFLKTEENEFAYALFDCGVEEGHYFSEDWLFCHRWSKLSKGEDKKHIWMDISIQLTHTGVEDYSGSFISTII
jgi:hypothetical protein